MFSLPAPTEFGKRIPKQKFYEYMTLSSELKRAFSEQINTIYWSNKISPDTVNIAPGENVHELEVFTIRLNQSALDKKVLQEIDKQIPYHILFVLEYDRMLQAWIGYKEPSLAGNNSFKVNSYYRTDWLAPEALTLRIEGLSMDAVYGNFVRQIAGERLCSLPDEFAATPFNLRDAVERDELQQQLLKQIAVLENKVRNEKQFNKQVELNAELKALKEELEGASLGKEL